MLTAANPRKPRFCARELPAFEPSVDRIRPFVRTDRQAQTPSVFALILGLLVLAGCDSQADARSEARLLLTQLNAVSDERSLLERATALDALTRLPLKVPAHVHARDACRDAHRALLDAETSQASARKALSEATAGQPGSALSQQSGQAIAAEIDRSNRGLAQAKLQFPACERAMRALVNEAH
jgi:hypothetical protein